MQRGAETKVGLIVLLAALLLGYFAFSIRRVSAVKTYSIYVTFANARGLERGDPVRMAGVRIGEVRSVGLRGAAALVELALDRRFPIFANYRIQVTSSGLLQERYVEVIPTVEAERGARLEPGSTVPGGAAVDLTEIMESGQQLLKSAGRIATAVERITSNEQMVAQFQAAIANLAEATDRAVALTAAATEITHAAGPQLQATVQGLRRAADDIEVATRAVRTRVAEGEILPNIEEVTRRALRFSDTMNQFADNLSAFATDPALQAELRDTVADLRAGAADLRTIAADLKVFAGKAREAAPAIPKAAEGAASLLQTAADIKERLRPPQIQPSFDMIIAPQTNEIFSSARIDLSWTEGRFFRLGVDDIGEGSTAEAQVGDRRGRRVLRYGLYRSQLAVGLDLPLSHTTSLSATLFDPNDLRVDALVGIPVIHDRTDVSLLLGARDIGSSPLYVGGVRFTR